MDKELILAIMAIRLIYAGIHIITKEAFNGGMNTFVFVFYRQAAASLFLIPVCIFERKNIQRNVQSVSPRTIIKMFMLALVGIAISLNTSSKAIKYTSSSLSAATENTIPVITFILALLFRMETVNLKKLSGFAKILGVALFLAGIITISLYRGPHLRSLNPHHFFGNENSSSTDHGNTPSTRQWIMGCFLMIVANIEWCLWLVLQKGLLKELPSKLLFTSLQVIFSSFQAFIIALVAVRDFSQWKLGFDLRLVSVVYCGILITGVSFYLQTWCIERVGPVYLAATTPLTIVITLACLSFVLGETIQLGSVIGGILMVGGLYSVLFGKSKEKIEDSSNEIKSNEEICSEGVDSSMHDCSDTKNMDIHP